LKSFRKPRVIFITGTDTGVGKTVLTSLLLAHLRRTGQRALAVKPFCSGRRADAELLAALQDHELPLDLVNPWYFPEPVAPLVAARMHRTEIKLHQVVAFIRQVALLLANSPSSVHSSRVSSPTLLIEGSGGLLVPLGAKFTVLDLLVRLRSEVLLVSANRLGTINHTLLSLRALKAAGLPCRVVLMDVSELSIRDSSTSANGRILREFLDGTTLFPLPFLGHRCELPDPIRASSIRLSRQLRAILRAPKPPGS
jgi:dethiobiotin synthetase